MVLGPKGPRKDAKGPNLGPKCSRKDHKGPR